MNRDQLETAFEALSARLVERDTEATVVLFGDAAMMFAYDARSEIDHVDVQASPRGQVLGAARDVAQAIGLPAHWINDQAVGSLPAHLPDDIIELWSRPNLAVRALGPELMLAMRAVVAKTPADADDVRLLAERAGIESLIDIEVLVAELYPGRSLSTKARDLLEPIF